MRIGRASSLRCGGHDLTQRLGERGRRRRCTPLGRYLGQPREVVGRERAQRGREPAGLDPGVVPDQLDGDRVGIETREDVGEQPGGEHDASLALALGRRVDPDRQLEIGSDELDRPRTQGDPQPGQHGKGPGARCDGTLCGGDRVGQGLALSAELHWFSSPRVFLRTLYFISLP